MELFEQGPRAVAQSGTDHPLFECLPEHVSGEPSKYESPDTTHYSIVDTEGNVVSNTYTLNDSYGSGVTARGTGILLGHRHRSEGRNADGRLRSAPRRSRRRVLSST